MKANWPLMKREYAQSEQPVSLEELAMKHSVHKRTVEEHSRNEDWPGERRKFYSETAEKVRELGAKQAAKRKVSELEAAERTSEVLSAAIAAIAQTVEKRGFADKVGKIESAKILERLSSVSAAQDKILRVIQLLKGSPDSRQAIDLAALLSGDEEKEPQ